MMGPAALELAIYHADEKNKSIINLFIKRAINLNCATNNNNNNENSNNNELPEVFTRVNLISGQKIESCKQKPKRRPCTSPVFNQDFTFDLSGRAFAGCFFDVTLCGEGKTGSQQSLGHLRVSSQPFGQVPRVYMLEGPDCAPSCSDGTQLQISTHDFISFHNEIKPDPTKELLALLETPTKDEVMITRALLDQ